MSAQVLQALISAHSGSFGHTEGIDPVDHRYSSVGLHLLGLEWTSAQPRTNQRLVTVHGSLAEGAAVVAHLSLPFFTTLRRFAGSDGLCSRMVVPPFHSAFSRRGQEEPTVLAYTSVGVTGVVGTVAADITKRLVVAELVQQVGEHLTITQFHGGELSNDDIVGIRVNTQVQLALGSALPYAVLADFPLAFAIDLEPGRVDHDIHRSGW